MTTTTIHCFILRQHSTSTLRFGYTYAGIFSSVQYIT